MKHRLQFLKLTAVILVAIVALMVPRVADAVVLVNPGFDTDNAGAGDVPGATGWNSFEFAFTTNDVSPVSSPNTLKLFGPFSQFGASGVFQGGFPASAGETWAASAMARIDGSDPMDPQNFAVVKLEFLNAANSVIGFVESPQITTLSLPVNTWEEFTALGTAPAGTVTAQIVLLHVQLDNPVSGGSIFYDNAALGVVIPEPGSLTLLALGGTLLLARRRKR